MFLRDFTVGKYCLIYCHVRAKVLYFFYTFFEKKYKIYNNDRYYTTRNWRTEKIFDGILVSVEDIQDL